MQILKCFFRCHEIGPKFNIGLHLTFVSIKRKLKMNWEFQYLNLELFFSILHAGTNVFLSLPKHPLPSPPVCSDAHLEIAETKGGTEIVWDSLNITVLLSFGRKSTRFRCFLFWLISRSADARCILKEVLLIKVSFADPVIFAGSCNLLIAPSTRALMTAVRRSITCFQAVTGVGRVEEI